MKKACHIFVFILINTITIPVFSQGQTVLEARLIHDGPVCDSGYLLANGTLVANFLLIDGDDLFSENQAFQMTGEIVKDGTVDSILLKEQPIVDLELRSFVENKNIRLVFMHQWQASYGLSPRNNGDRKLGKNTMVLGSYLDSGDCTVDSFLDAQTVLDRKGPIEWTNSFELFSKSVTSIKPLTGFFFTTKALEGASYVDDSGKGFKRVDKQQIYFPEKAEELFKKDDPIGECFSATVRAAAHNKKYKILTENQCDVWELTNFPSFGEGGGIVINGKYVSALTDLNETLFLSVKEIGTVLGIPLSGSLLIKNDVNDINTTFFYRKTGTDDWVEIGKMKLKPD